MSVDGEGFIPAACLWPVPPLSLHIFVAKGELLCCGSRFLHRDFSLPVRNIVASHYLGELSGQACGVHLLAEPQRLDGCAWQGLRSLLGHVDDVQFALAGRALQVANWDLDHRFCGRCGNSTDYHHSDRARVCPQCRLTVYPRISPCVIMLITRGEECLLARHRQYRHSLFTALAGFIEPGETAEQAVVRETREEVGLEVGQCHYIGSQPWPFPGQLMLGFLAELAGGELRPDLEEIAEAGWFHYSALPQIPPPQTLSGELIRTFVDSNGRQAW